MTVPLSKMNPRESHTRDTIDFAVRSVSFLVDNTAYLLVWCITIWFFILLHLGRVLNLLPADFLEALDLLYQEAVRRHNTAQSQDPQSKSDKFEQNEGTSREPDMYPESQKCSKSESSPVEQNEDSQCESHTSPQSESENQSQL